MPACAGDKEELRTVKSPVSTLDSGGFFKKPDGFGKGLFTASVSEFTTASRYEGDGNETTGIAKVNLAISPDSIK
jgi:hypothetical protein